VDQLGKRDNVRDLLIEEEMQHSYLTYAMSVIVSRALPDVRDGLKPSQRRILVAMNDLNLGPRSRFRKCAKICGDTSGNYHPHGEGVIYPTLVRLAQEFIMRYPLIDGQGNFGSVDGDPPAAMRYTEARLSAVAMEMLEDIEKDTVDYEPNYDSTRVEPAVLPSRFPNLLCNGSSGIAVGMATSVPPNNLVEVCDALIKVIENPDVTVAELLRVLPGPDFPTGGVICGRAGILQGYTTGRGTITLRGRTHLETVRGGRQNIVITEIPYALNKTTLKERLAEAINKGTIEGVSDLRDESDREGMRIVVELKRDADDQVVLNQLFKHTPLQSTFSIILLALVEGRPVTMSVKDFLVAFKNYRMEVVRRRTRYLLERAEARAHILEGLLIALDQIDAVIDTIRKSADVPTAHDRLMKRFHLSDRQATAILEMRLQRLTGLERKSIAEELATLRDDIEGYRALLADESLVLDVIREDLYELKERYGDDRRTEIVEAETDLNMEDLVAEEDVAVTVSHAGYVKRMPLGLYRRQRRGGKGVAGAQPREGDFVEHLFIASTHDYLLFFTDRGKVYWQKVYDIPQLSRTARGRAIVNLLELDGGETITSMVPVRNFDERQLLMATARGVVKKTPLADYSRPKRGGIIAINLDEGDTLIGCQLTRGNDEIILGTRLGYALRFRDSTLRSLSRATRGVRGISLRAKDAVVGMMVVDERATLLTVCAHGYGKRTSFKEHRLQGRGGLGIINIRASTRNGEVIGLLDVLDDDELMLITTGGNVIRLPVSDIRTIGRNTQGVRLIRLEKEDRLASVARVVKEEGGSAEEGAEAEGAESAEGTEPEEAEGEEEEKPEQADADSEESDGEEGSSAAP
jgi:DNA gyrase subunit A